MALAEYFHRAADSAVQILQGTDRGEFERRLHGVRVTIAYDAQGHTVEGRALLDMSVRLLARLYPSLTLTSLAGAEPIAELGILAAAINPQIEPGDLREVPEIAIVVGETAYSCSQAIYAGSHGWIARLSTNAPVGSGTSEIPFGAGAAACLAAANLFRFIFGDLLEKGDLDGDVSLSLLTFETRGRLLNPPLPADTTIGSVHLVGLGAIGNAVAWTLSRHAGLLGEVHLVDHEAIDLGNLQRYVLAERGNVGAVKVHHIAGHFPGASSITAIAHEGTWSQYIKHAKTHDVGLVITALDSAADRILVQGSLPKSILNAWTQPGDVGISRHPNFADTACLACLYLPSGPGRNDDETFAEQLRLTDRLMDVRQLLYSGNPIGIELTRLIAERANVDPALLEPYAGMPLRTFRAKAMCGAGVLSAPDADGADLQVPLAFQSAMAGIMVAAELVAEAAGLRRKSLPTKSVIDLLRPVPRRLNVPVQKIVAGPARCICADADYINTYRRKHGAARRIETHQVKPAALSPASQP